MTSPTNGSRRTLAELAVPSEPGNERRAMEAVAGTVEVLGLPKRTFERLKTAVAEATMNAMEHGNHYREEAPVLMRGLGLGRRSLRQDHGEDEMWQKTLSNLAAHFGVRRPVETHVVCVDPSLQWREYKNIGHNDGIRSALYTMTAPLRWRRARRG